MCEIEKCNLHDIDDKVFIKLEFIRDNYNKILLNIQKMISSSPILLEMREKYENNKSSLTEVYQDRENEKLNKNFNSGVNIKNGNSNTLSEGKEWLDKLDNDINTLNKDQDINHDKYNGTKNKESLSSSIISKKEKKYSVDQDLDTIIHNFQKTAEDRKYRSTDKKKGTVKKIQTNSKSKSRNYISSEKSLSLGTAFTNKTIPQRVTYENIKNLTDELDHLKKFCKDLKTSHVENCIMENEKKNFDKIKNDHIKLHADMSILKEDIKEILTNYQQIAKRVNFLEEENKNLRQHNKNLVKFIQGGEPNRKNNFDHNNYDNNFNYTTPVGMGNLNNINNINIIDEDTNHSIRNTTKCFDRNINVENSTPLSELSAFNTVHNQSSVEMNYNINNNLEKGKKRRFLIPKSEDFSNNY